MRIPAARILAPGLSIAAGAVVLVCTGLLVAANLELRDRKPDETALLENLEERVLTEADAAPVLAEERDRVTLDSLEREDRHATVAWTLLVAAAAFVTGVKWWTSQRPTSTPSLERILAEVRSAQELPSLGGVAAATNGRPRVAAGEEVDLAPVDEIVAREGRDSEAAIPILQAIQAHYGYLPDEALRRVCERTAITPAQIAGTSSFYANFRRSPLGDHLVKVCHGTACHVSGARQISEEIRRHLGIEADADTDPEGEFTVDEVACLGCCSLAPVMTVDEATAGRLTPASACRALDTLRGARVG